MRSGLIFAISEKVSNRYMLCRMLAASARKMHRDGVSISQSINRSLQVLHKSPATGDPIPSAPAVQSQDEAPENEAAALAP
jgi:hypothetical protein